jgi:hypothetical protein
MNNARLLFFPLSQTGNQFIQVTIAFFSDLILDFPKFFNNRVPIFMTARAVK